jgi:hypothetical protein
MIGYSKAVQFGVRALVAAAVLAILWWAVVMPRQQLSAERAAHAETKASHAAILAGIADQTAEVARKAAVARTEFEAYRADAKVQRDEAERQAFERGKSTAARIGSGAVVVREQWRDRECPVAAPGQGAELTPGFALVDRGRAEAIGRVLGLAGSFDASYREAYERLTAAQGLLNACYEQPAE